MIFCSDENCSQNVPIPSLELHPVRLFISLKISLKPRQISSTIQCFVSFELRDVSFFSLSPF